MRRSINEEWREVVGYEGWYQVSNLGNVRSVEREVNYKDTSYTSKRRSYILKAKIGQHGYKEVVLVQNGARRTCRVHRLVAQAFIPNPNNLPTVNHLDENKTNNIVDNLEWSSVRHNTLYSMKETSILKYSASGELVGKYSHFTDAGESVDGNKHGVYKCCKGKLKTYKGFIWKIENQ